MRESFVQQIDGGRDHSPFQLFANGVYGERESHNDN
jgi:hypothetical protein